MAALINKLISLLMERPLFYRLIQGTLAQQGHNTIKIFLLSNIPKNADKTLDQGCGTGEYCKLFKNHYFGIDNNSADIKYAQKNYHGKFMVGTADNLLFPDDFFDVVFAVGLHHHLNNKEFTKAVEEAIRVTKKGGRIIIIDAMLPKNRLNLVGWILRKMDRGKYVRKYQDTLKLLPPKNIFGYKILSSWPFDYIAVMLTKNQVKGSN